MVLIVQYKDLWLVFEGYVIVRLFSKMFGSHSFACQSLLLGTNIPNDTYVCMYQLKDGHKCYT